MLCLIYIKRLTEPTVTMLMRHNEFIGNNHFFVKISMAHTVEYTYSNLGRNRRIHPSLVLPMVDQQKMGRGHACDDCCSVGIRDTYFFV